MVKSKTIYVCQNCGAKETKWTGRCNVCGEWNSFVEEVEVTSKSRGNAVIGNPSSKALRLSEIKVNADVRMDTGDNELNRVLGGGMVPGSMILLGGEFPVVCLRFVNVPIPYSVLAKKIRFLLY